jgi:hypothetical protein
VELPPWLSSDVTHHLLQQFKDFAKAEVKTMMQTISQSTTRLVHAPSSESVFESSEREEEENHQILAG